MSDHGTPGAGWGGLAYEPIEWSDFLAAVRYKLLRMARAILGEEKSSRAVVRIRVAAHGSTGRARRNTEQ